jgi:L-ascorbate metabolism protein UlaG (beta-lactamase superfamily)
LNIRDLVVFLDAYIDRVPSAAPTGITVEGIQRADWVVVGHSHFDHLYGAERIAKATGATIIGSYETVRVMETMGVPLSQLMPVAGGERIQLAKDVVVHVYPSQHSCVWTNPAMPASDQVCLGDLGVLYQEQQARFKELWNRLQSAGAEILTHLTASHQGARGDGGALVYLFETPEGSLLFQDTSGHWSGIFHNLRPDVAILAAAGRGNIDGEPIQGTLAQFVARQADLLRPGKVVLSHHDNWLPGFSQAVEVAPIRAELARRTPETKLIEMGYLTAHPIFAR